MNTAPAKRVRWTVTDYFRMAEAGLLDDRRVELLNGEIIEVPAQATPHGAAVSKITLLLADAFDRAKDWVVCQGTIRLSRYSAPDPDFHVFDVPIGTPDDQLPAPLVVIEVSDTTHAKDAGPKLRAYAAAGVADYWIVNISARRVEVYRRPENPTPARRSGWRYGETTHYHPGDSVRPLRRPQIALPADAMLP